MKLGFVGLGNMGSAIARNLIKAGHQVTVYNRTRSKAEALRPEGATVAETPAEAASTGLVFTMLADDSAVEQVAFGDKGIIGALPRDGVHISLSTIGAGFSGRLAQSHRDAGQRYAASPVFGRPDSAASAKLTIVIAGDDQAIERARPLLDAIGQKTFILGSEASSANVVKINGNFLLANMIEAFGEIFAVLGKYGIDPKQFLEIVNGNLFRSPVMQNYGNIIADERFDPAGFKLKLGLKDVKLAIAAAEDVNMPFPMASLLRDRFLMAVAQGKGEKDWSAVSTVSKL